MLKKLKLQVTSLTIALTLLAGGVTVMAADGDKTYDPFPVGVTTEVTVEGNCVIYSFTPEETGTYYLFSDSDQSYYYSDEEGVDYINIDPIVYVYDADPSNNSTVTEDDDSYYGYNFFLRYEFKQGVTYYFEFSKCNSYSVSYDVTLVPAFEIGFDESEDFIDFVLVDPDEEFTLYAKTNNDILPDPSSGGVVTNVDKEGIHFKNGVDDNTWVLYNLVELYDYLGQVEADESDEADEVACKWFDVFVMGETVDGTFESGQTVHIDNEYTGVEIEKKEYEGEEAILAPREDGEEESILQMIYSFTPEKDGTVKISITNIEDGLPAVALFGSDYSFIGKIVGYDFEEFKEYANYMMEIEPRDGEGDSSEEGLVLEASLEAGKVYYVAIPLSSPGFDLHSEFDVTLEFEEKKEEENNNNQEGNNNQEENNNQGNENEGNGGESDKDEKNVEAFVKRLYEEVFGRDADEGGLKYWVDRINNGATGADVVKEFLASPEFDGKKLNDEDFVIKLYSIFFGRVPGKDEIKFWVDSLKTDSRDTVVNNFINTTEWDEFCKSYGVKSGARFPINDPSNILDFAKRLYTCCLERDPDESGLNFWNDALVNHKMTGTQVAKEFFWSAEFLSFKTSDAEFITRLYRTMMGREPEPEGFAFWMNDIKVESREEVFMGFATSPEFKGVCEKCGISWM